MHYETLTEINESDVKSISNLIAQMNPKYPLNITKEFLSKIVDNPATSVIVSRDETKGIVGVLSMTTFQAITGSKTWIEDVVVDKDSRGKGIGTRLMKFALETARQNGITHINLTSNPTRVEANKLYQKLGFTIINTNYYRYTLV